MPGDCIPAFEGPEFQPNVILQKTVGEKGSGIDGFKGKEGPRFLLEGADARVYIGLHLSAEEKNYRHAVAPRLWRGLLKRGCRVKLPNLRAMK
jgi:hypothetical protein